MKRIFGFLVALIATVAVYGQGEGKPIQPDIPGDIMIDFGFSSLFDDPKTIKTDFWPTTSLGFRYMFTHKFNDYLTVNPSIGITFEKYGFLYGSNFAVDSLKQISWDTLQFVDLRQNKLAANYIDLPIEFRYYPLKTIDGEGFFIGFGGMIGAKVGSSTKVKYTAYNERYKERLSNHFGLADFRYGIVGRIGFKGINGFVKYYFSELWRNAPVDGATPNQFTFGLNFTGF